MTESVVYVSTIGLMLLVLLHIAAGGWLFLIVWGVSRRWAVWQRLFLALVAGFVAVQVQVLAYAMMRIDNYLLLPEWLLAVPAGTYVALWLVLCVGLVRNSAREPK